jgi:hypothetical protein
MDRLKVKCTYSLQVILKLISVGFFCFTATILIGQNSCISSPNNAFQPSELITYKATYHWGIIDADAGFAEFRVLSDSIKKKPVFKFQAVGYSNPDYDWVYKVRDTIESLADTLTLLPYKFSRNAKEGSREMLENALFKPAKKMVFTFISDTRNPVKRDSITISNCTFDVLSGIYAVRNMDFSELPINDTKPIDLYVDNEFHHTYIRYLGKDTISTSNFKQVPCIKFRGNLIEGDFFPKGELMTVWVTDDQNKIPVYVETKILIGRLKIYLLDYQNLKYESLLDIRNE